jgi:hypothetical protein
MQIAEIKCRFDVNARFCRMLGAFVACGLPYVVCGRQICLCCHSPLYKNEGAADYIHTRLAFTKTGLGTLSKTQTRRRLRQNTQR